jgi:hypothetical protein
MMTWLRFDDKPIEYGIVSLLASIVMYGLLILVIRAPDDFFIRAIAFLSGLSLAGAVGSVFWGVEEDSVPK